MGQAVLDLSVDSPERWKDESGHGNHGVQATPANQPAIITNGQMFNNGSCYYFDGTDYMIIADNADLDFAGKKITFEFWFKCSTLPTGWDALFTKGYTGPAGWSILWGSVANAGKILFTSGGVNSCSIWTTTTYVDNRWHKYSLVFDGSIGWLYIDGEYSNQDDYANLTDNPGELIICGASDYTHNPPMYLVRPRLYHSAFSAAKIASRFRFDKLTLKR